MQFKELASILIPGYSSLSKEQRTAFQSTKSGVMFAETVSELLENTKHRSDCYTEKFNARKKDLLNVIQESQEYKGLVATIISLLLEKELPGYQSLKPNDKSKIARASFSKQLIEFIEYQQEAEYLKGKEGSEPLIKKIDTKKTEIFSQWFKKFKQQANFARIREALASNNAKKRAEKLVKAFPLLKLSPRFAEKSLEEEFIENYTKRSKEDNPDFERIEKEFLAVSLFNYLQETTEQIKFLDLKSFNLSAAEWLAELIQQAADKDENCNFEEWAGRYEEALNTYILEALQYSKGKVRETNSLEDTKGLLESLSYLFKNNETVDKGIEYFNKLADAHAFIQYLGISTQNESSYLTIVDLYNYGRSYEHISTVRAMLESFIVSFRPLWEEYVQAASREKSNFRKIFRLVMPMIIVAAVVVIVGALIATMAPYELAFLIAAIPAVIIGLYLASKYVVLKNYLAVSFDQYWAGCVYEVDQFQVNERMINAFGSKKNAEAIRTIYIEEFQRCDEIEAYYRPKAEAGILETEEKELQEQNRSLRNSLAMEWYDIHSNYDSETQKGLGVELVYPQIVRKRLITIANEEIEQMNEEIEKDFPQIKKAVEHLVNDLKTKFSSAPQASVKTKPQAQKKENQEKLSSPASFFSLAYRERAMRIDNTMENITNLSV